MEVLLDDIKKEATGNKTKIQSSEATKLEGILNKLFFLEKDVYPTNFSSALEKEQGDWSI